ncbi:hypothetical protein [Gemmatimonas sp. UBA7669]|uniref:hypothetical protein n=1 Tax=Gemmatimonas sp. UBA7669 TaxID=1946568 RepID=UPI0025C305FF|nr:hypothetical protein [Gemmatimonas sp. UBA7669]
MSSRHAGSPRKQQIPNGLYGLSEAAAASQGSVPDAGGSTRRPSSAAIGAVQR